ncbi:uncharacterized protein LOC119738160 [Patiria miniata]|uniref:Protein Lines n=1 Tax=Patiria miniata TaxID=46514 RepID=A0A914AYQ9_PATMI|nr:uncharacterized protein LOC119738160 [Patiria miniata]
MAQLDAAVIKLNQHLLDNTCLCDMDEASELRGMSALKSWLRGEDNVQDVLEGLLEDTLENNMKKPDRMLVGLTISKHLFEATHCAHVLHLQRQMVDSGSLLEDLGTLMSSEDRLTAFMTCQMAKAVLSSPAIDKEKAVLFLHQHLLGIGTVIRHAGHHHQTLGLVNSPSQCRQNQPNYHGQKQRNQVSPVEVSKGQMDPDQVNLNPDDSSQVCKGLVGSGQMSAQSYLGQESTGHSHATRDLGNVSKIQSHLDRSTTHLGQVNHAVFTLDLCRLLLKKICHEGSRQVKSENTGTSQGSQQPSCIQAAHSIADTGFGRLQDCQKELRHLLCRDLPCILQDFALPLPADEPHRVNMDTKDTILILASLLDLVHALLKHRHVEQHWQGFTSKLGSSLMHLFKDYCHDVIILKRLLDIFVLFTDYSPVTSCIPHSGQSHSSHPLVATLDDALITTAAGFVSMVAKGSFLEHIPYRSGPIGFGGGHFHPSSSNHEDKSGDHPLLRKLYQATLCAVKTLLNCHKSKTIYDESDVGGCLRNLWGYVCCKLNHIIPTDAHIWLVFELFSEQDDGLVWVMHCSLDLYKASQSLHPPCSLLVGQLNPHRIFCRFLDTVAYDPSVLLDLLISSETPFLEYLVCYLHTVLRDWDSFCSSLQEVASMDSKSHSQNSADVASIKPPVDEKPYFAKCESSHTHQEREEGVETSIKTKRRKTQVDGDTHQETARPKDELEYTSSSQATSSPAGAGNFSCNSCKRTDAEDIKRTPAQDSSEALSTSPNDQTLEMLCSQTNIVSQPLDDVMTTLIRLRFSIARISGSNLFPYPITPLLRLLERVEGMYEGDISEGS